MEILPTTHIKENAIRSFVFKWIREPGMHCNYCGMEFGAIDPRTVEACCDTPQVGTNAQILHAFILDNKRIRDTRMNKFASNKDKTFRMSFSLPPKLMRDIQGYCLSEMKEPFIRPGKETQDINDFARAFPEFRVCEKV